ncbi:DUF6334 family protein [Acinetobacter seifertii]|uniref:DUF6334 family protein n=1 Tax=Acinetobacter seifertii TaxID=1530123 RepID=UPI00083AFC6C|nr:DUF6334 family protein [Acinetobacter seifertii]OCZ52230.1 hypothetical protein A7P21_13040 [Acinetobacter seifertii]
MVQSDIFDAIKNIDEVRKIDDLYLVVDENSNSEDAVESITFEINKKFWAITVNHNFDEIELKVFSYLPEKTTQQRCSNNLSSLKGLEIGTMFAIVNERGYTDGIKLMLYDYSLKESKTDPFFAVLTIVALASGLQYELRKTGIDTHLV